MSYFIQSDRLYFREIRPTDINEKYYAWVNDPLITDFLEIKFQPNSMKSISEFVESMNHANNQNLMAICWKENDTHIGNIKLGPINPDHRFSDLSLFIGEQDYWGKGVATEAIKAISEYAFLKKNINKIIAGIYAINKGCIKAFEKAGYTKEATFKNMRFYNGKFIDQVNYSLNFEDWQLINSAK